MVKADTTNIAEQFRPVVPKQLVGAVQRKTAEGLLEGIAKGEVHREMLFEGPSGVGKTTVALIYLAAALEVPYEKLEHYVTIVNCGDTRGINDIRDRVVYRMRMNPTPPAKFNAFLLDEIHKLTGDAQSLLLTEIEPVPEHCILIGCTTESDKLLTTLYDRFTKVRLPGLSVVDIELKRGWIFNKLGIVIGQNGMTTAIAEDMVLAAGGSMRRMEKFVEEFIATGTYQMSVPKELDEADPESLINKIFFKKSPLHVVLKGTPDDLDGDAYQRLERGFIGMALKLLASPTTIGRTAKLCHAIIAEFSATPNFQLGYRLNFKSKLAKAFYLADGSKEM